MLKLYPSSPKEFRQALAFETVLVLLLAVTGGYQYVHNLTSGAAKERDAIRLAEFVLIQDSLRTYALAHGTYPVCLYKTKGCASLEDSTSVPRDPVTNSKYSYASYGQGTYCTGYHIGASLERRGSQALLTGSDAPPKASRYLCKGSSTDFSGLSSAPGGQPCSLTVGTPQPTDRADGETCYDIARNRLPQP